MTTTFPEILTTAEAAAFFGVCRRTFDRWLANGWIRGYRGPHGGPWKFDRADLEALKERWKEETNWRIA